MATPRRLPRGLSAYRMGDPDGAHGVYSGEGARDFPGRWNDRGEPVIYASEHYSTAMLEKLVRTGEMPPNQHFVEITLPKGLSYEVVTADSLPGWCDANGAVARAHGSDWFRERRSCLLFVPSVVARMERNVLINPLHEEADEIEVGLETPVWWDERLFAR